MSNTIGILYRLTSFGESHGMAVGGIIDSCPAGVSIDINEIQKQLDRRKPGQSELTTSRNEEDKVVFLSGIFEGKSLGTPIAFYILNKDQNSKDYTSLESVYRPSHADYTYESKYGIRDYRGGGRASARTTASIVVAGTIAKMLLQHLNSINCIAFVSRVGAIAASIDVRKVESKDVYSNEIRCPDSVSASLMIELIKDVKNSGDSVGGVISCVIKNVPVGLGEPLFNKLQASLASAMLSINAVHGFENGAGFEGASKRGSELNDAFDLDENKNVITKTNNSGGIQGGISNGMDIYFNVAFKPTASIQIIQDSITKDGKLSNVKTEGRHDPCVLPRAVPIVEAIAYLVMADMVLLNRSSKINISSH